MLAIHKATAEKFAFNRDTAVLQSSLLQFHTHGLKTLVKIYFCFDFSALEISSSQLLLIDNRLCVIKDNYLKGSSRWDVALN